MYKIRFDVEYGFKTDKTQEEAINIICEQLNIKPGQIKNMQFYNMDRWETELEEIHLGHLSKNNKKLEKKYSGGEIDESEM